MTTATWARHCVCAAVLLVGLASVVSAKKPPKDDPPPRPILYEIEWLPDMTEPRDAEFVDDVLVVVGRTGDRALVYTEAEGTIDLTGLIEQSSDIMLVPDITLDGITLTTAACINDLGQITGKYVKHDGDDVSDAGIYVWDPNAEIPTLYTRSLPDVYWVYDISDGALGQALPWDGTVVGVVSDSNSEEWGFVWQPDPVNEFFGFLPIYPIYCVSGINRDGQVVGRIPLSHGYVIYSYTLEIDDETGELTGEPTILSDTKKTGPGDYRYTGRFSWFRDRIDVNDNGFVVGNVEVKRVPVPALYDGIWTELTVEEAGYTVAINNGDRICGITPTDDSFTPDTGFVYHPIDGYWSLNDLIDIEGDPEDAAIWFSGDARDKCLPKGMSNDDSTGYGTIVGQKWGWGGFVLRPLPPPPQGE